MTLNANIGFNGVLIISSSGSLTGTSRDITLNNNAKAFIDGTVSIRDLSLNSSSDLTASAAISGRNLSVESSSDFTTTNTLSLSNDFTVNGGAFSSTSSISVGDDFELNSSGTASISGAVSVGDNMTLNSSTSATFGSTVGIGNNFEANSSATAVFNGNVAIGNDATFNSGTNISVNAQFEVVDDIELNGATLNVSASGNMSAGDDLIINSSSNVTNTGSLSAGDDIQLNGGTITNTGNFIAGDDIIHNSGATVTNNAPGRIEAGDDYTKNGGTLTNNHHMVVGDRLTVNSGGSFSGNGKLQVERITNWGGITGNMDICSSSGTTPTITGSGAFSGSTTFCDNPSIFPLPVELLSFEGISQESGIELRWLTASEYRNAFFTLERRNSIGAFEFLAEIAGAGTTNSTSEYTWIDDNIGSDEMYYRLSQTDEDGTVTYLKIILVELLDEEKERITVFPNPFTTQVSVLAGEEEILSVKIIDINGHVVYALQTQSLDRTSFISIDNKALQAGVYTLILETHQGISHHKILKRSN
jgi:hypothetical protein